jgi:hypothetical protein
VGYQSVDGTGSSILQNTSGEPDSVSSIDHIIHQNGNFTPDVSYEQFHLFDSSTFFLFVY